MQLRPEPEVPSPDVSVEYGVGSRLRFTGASWTEFVSSVRR